MISLHTDHHLYIRLYLFQIQNTKSRVKASDNVRNDDRCLLCYVFDSTGHDRR